MNELKKKLLLLKSLNPPNSKEDAEKAADILNEINSFSHVTNVDFRNFLDKLGQFVSTSEKLYGMTVHKVADFDNYVYHSEKAMDLIEHMEELLAILDKLGIRDLNDIDFYLKK